MPRLSGKNIGKSGCPYATLVFNQVVQSISERLADSREPLQWLEEVKAMRLEETYLQLNFSLRNVLFTTAPIRNLVRLGDLRLHGLGAEIFQRVALNGINAHLGVGLDNRKAARHWRSNVSTSLQCSTH
jgi:hypothetical protein